MRGSPASLPIHGHTSASSPLISRLRRQLLPQGRSLFQQESISYFHHGGFPECALMKVKRDYLLSVYQKIYLNEVVARNSITNIFGLKVMIKKIAESVKQPISFSRIANIVSSTGTKLSTTSAVKYMEYMESSWLITKVTNMAAKLADKESNAKFYFTDNGILDLFLMDADTSLLENLVAFSLIRRLSSAFDGLYIPASANSPSKHKSSSNSGQ